MTAKIKGLIFILLADLLWSLSAIASKFLFSLKVNPLDLAQMRITISFVILALIILVSKPHLCRIRPADLGYFTIFGLLGLTAVQFTYLFTISQTNVATAVFLQYLAPIFILGYSVLTHKEVISFSKTATVLLAMMGGYLIVKGNPGSGLSVTPLGLVSGLASAVFFAFYTMYGKKGLRRYSPWTLLVWAMGIGAIAWSFYRLPWNTFFSYGPREWLFFSYIGILATIVPFGLYFIGLKTLTPVVTVITSSMEPVFSAVLAFCILGETLTAWQIMGAILIIAAVTALQLIPEPAGSSD